MFWYFVVAVIAFVGGAVFGAWNKKKVQKALNDATAKYNELVNK